MGMFRSEAAIRQLKARKQVYYSDLLRERAQALAEMQAAKTKYSNVLVALAEFKTLKLVDFEQETEAEASERRVAEGLEDLDNEAQND